MDKQEERNVTDLSQFKAENAVAIMREQLGGYDGLSEYMITGGIWVDATSVGMPAHEIAVCFFMATDALDFEARVMVEMDKRGLVSISKRDDDNAKALREMMFSVEPQGEA